MGGAGVRALIENEGFKSIEHCMLQAACPGWTVPTGWS